MARVVFNGRPPKSWASTCARARRCTWKAACAPASGRDQSGVENTAPKSAPTRCRCSAAAKAWAAKVAASKVAYDDGGYGDQGGGGYEPQAPRAAPTNAPWRACTRPAPAPWRRPPRAASGFDDMDDDIPF